MVTRAPRSKLAHRALWLLVAWAATAPASAQPGPPASAPAGGPRVADPAGRDAAITQRASRADAETAIETLNKLVAAYEASDLAAFEALLANSLMGRQRMIEGFVRGLSDQRNVRIHLLDLQVTAGPEVAFIQAAWERRSLAGATFVPQLTSGRFSLLARRGSGGVRWTIAAIDGDNPFAPAASTLVGARLALSPASVPISRLSAQCPGTTPPAVVTTPVAGSLTGTATFAPGTTRATAALAGSVTGARVGNVPVGLPGYTVTLATRQPPAAPLTVQISLPVNGSADGPPGGPFAITATGAGFNATVSYADPTPPALTIAATGTMTGTLTIPARGFTAAGTVNGTLLAAGLPAIVVRIDDVRLPLTVLTGVRLPAERSVPVTGGAVATLTRGGDGRYAGAGAASLSGTLVWITDGVPSSGSIEGAVDFSVAPTAALPRAPLLVQASGPAVDLSATAGNAGPACENAPISIEVLAPAQSGRSSIAVQIATEQGDRELLTLAEVSPGRFARSGVPMARTGGTRPGNGIVDIVDPGSTVTVTYVDDTPQAGRPALRPVEAMLRVQ